MQKESDADLPSTNRHAHPTGSHHQWTVLSFPVNISKRCTSSMVASLLLMLWRSMRGINIK